MSVYDRLPEPVREHAKVVARLKLLEEFAGSVNRILRETEERLSSGGLERQHQWARSPQAHAFWEIVREQEKMQKAGLMPWWNNL